MYYAELFAKCDVDMSWLASHQEFRDVDVACSCRGDCPVNEGLYAYARCGGRKSRECLSGGVARVILAFPRRTSSEDSRP